jgi:hypothetical protein
MRDSGGLESSVSGPCCGWWSPRPPATAGIRRSCARGSSVRAIVLSGVAAADEDGADGEGGCGVEGEHGQADRGREGQAGVGGLEDGLSRVVGQELGDGVSDRAGRQRSQGGEEEEEEEEEEQAEEDGDGAGATADDRAQADGENAEEPEVEADADDGPQPSRATSARVKSKSANSAQAGPRHSPSAESNVAIASFNSPAVVRWVASARRDSNCEESDSPTSTRRTYPGVRVTSRSPTRARRRWTYFCNVDSAVFGGSSPQTMSISRSDDTTVLALATSPASTSRWRAPPRGSVLPPTTTSNGPSTRNSTRSGPSGMAARPPD